MKKVREKLLLVAILTLGLSFRVCGINWDQNQHLHPDERFLTMVTQAVQWPNSFSEYIDPQWSKLNPYNQERFHFFVYGTLPLKVVKFASGTIRFDNLSYNNITLVGRLVSALFDVGTLVLVYLIANKVFERKTAFVACFIYATNTLPIQLSHFYAVDTFLVFFLTLSFYLLLKLGSLHKLFSTSILLGVSFGFALASKVTALVFLPFTLTTYLFVTFKSKSFRKPFLGLLVFSSLGYLSFRIADPRIFFNNNFFDVTLNPIFVSNLQQLKSFNNPNSLFPPGVQWINTTPIFFPLKNMVLWGIGLPLGLFVIIGPFYSIWKQKQQIIMLLHKRLKFANHITTQQFGHLLIITWILLIFFYQGIQFVKTLRYFYPIYPFLAILVAYFLLSCSRTLEQKLKNKNIFVYLSSLTLLSFVIWPLSFVSIYLKPHSRVSASKWIYKNIPTGSTISCEHWDDCLPLALENNNSLIYKTEMLELFNTDTPEKWKKINRQLENVDYLILSSNRLWGSIPKVPERYPKTSQFYKDLFSEKLEFVKMAEFTSYPTIPLLGIKIDDSKADESFTVYDHPQVIIFKRLK